MARLLKTDKYGNAHILTDEGIKVIIEKNGAPLIKDNNVVVLDNATIHLDGGAIKINRVTTAVTSAEKYMLAGGE